MADVNRWRRHFKAVSIRSALERLGFKAEHKVGESLTRDRFIFCSGAMPSVLARRFSRSDFSSPKDRRKFGFSVKLRFHLLMRGKSTGATLTFEINEAFWFENRRWANRGLPYFHCLFSQDMVAGLPCATKIRFRFKGLGRSAALAVNPAVLKRDGRLWRKLLLCCLTDAGSPLIEAPTEPDPSWSGLYYIVEYGSWLEFAS